MTAPAAQLSTWAARDGRVAVATVVGLRGSAPRPLGTRMGVSVRGEVHGAVSGGCVEADVVRCATDALADDGRARLRSYGIVGDELVDVGLPCGGELDVLITVEDAATLARRSALEGAAEPSVLLTGIDQESLGARACASSAGTVGGDDRLRALAGAAADVLRLGRAALVEHEGRRALAEPLGVAPRLIVVGADDLAEGLCAAATSLGWRTAVADPRAAYATPARVPSAQVLRCAWPQSAIELLAPTPRCAVVVNTHEQRFDLPALLAALRSPAGYVGALGSRRNAERRRQRVRDAGATELDLLRLRSPCGLDLGAAGPAETALSILAEVLAVFNGRDGGILAASTAPIHPRLRELHLQPR